MPKLFFVTCLAASLVYSNNAIVGPSLSYGNTELHAQTNLSRCDVESGFVLSEEITMKALIAMNTQRDVVISVACIPRLFFQ